MLIDFSTCSYKRLTKKNVIIRLQIVANASPAATQGGGRA